MRREFICHRCGTANSRRAENCQFCGLQVGWRPSIPGFVRIWAWSGQMKETVACIAAFLCVALESGYPGTWASYLVSLPMLTVSALLLVARSVDESSSTEQRD